MIKSNRVNQKKAECTCGWVCEAGKIGWFAHAHFVVGKSWDWKWKEWICRDQSSGNIICHRNVWPSPFPRMAAALWQFSQINFLLSTKFSRVTSDAMTNLMKIISLRFSPSLWFIKLPLLAPAGALIVTVVYYSITSAATFWSFKHFCQYI